MLRVKPAQFAAIGAGILFFLFLLSQLGNQHTIRELGSWTAPSSSSYKNIDGDLKAKMARSEKLWQKTVDQRNAFRAQNPEIDFFPLTYPTDGQNFTNFSPLSVWDLVPASYNCPWEVERIGVMGDGGKWVCGMSRYEQAKDCIIYSFGVNTDSTFEQEMLERTNCQVWGYDPSVDKWGPQITPENMPRAHFLKAGISGETESEKEPPFYSFIDLMKLNGHDHIDLLKIDVEYAEFESLSALDKDTRFGGAEFPIGQMLIELHLFQNREITMKKFLNWWSKLEVRGMRPAWTEPNLLIVNYKVEDAQPRLAEYSLVNVDQKKNILFV